MEALQALPSEHIRKAATRLAQAEHPVRSGGYVELDGSILQVRRVPSESRPDDWAHAYTVLLASDLTTRCDCKGSRDGQWLCKHGALVRRYYQRSEEASIDDPH